MNRPVVSVCMPTRNRARWIGQAVDSVLRQTLQDFELIVSDDASTDGTEALVAGSADARLRYLRHAGPLGVAANRNICLEAARGRYVAWLDSDDLYHRDMLAVQVAALERNPRAVLAHSGFEVIDEEGNLRPGWPQPFADDAVEPGATAFGELALRDYIAAPTVVVRRRAHDLAGPYDTSLTSGEDWDMWLRLALEGDLAYTARPLARYRWHSESLTRTAEAGCAQIERDVEVITGIFRRHRDRIPEVRRLERQARAALAARAILRATDLLTRGKRRLVLACLAVAWRVRKARATRLVRLAAAGALGAEYAWHRASRALLAELSGELQGTRMFDDLYRLSMPDPAWEETLRDIARTVRQVVPPSEAIAVVDKWDPTLLHLSRRRGWHYPDRRLLDQGYPCDSAVAVRHLEDLRGRGARYLVIPSGRRWWLEHYGGLARYLEVRGDRVWEDGRCVIYRLLAGPTDHPEPFVSRCQAESS